MKRTTRLVFLKEIKMKNWINLQQNNVFSITRRDIFLEFSLVAHLWRLLQTALNDSGLKGFTSIPSLFNLVLKINKDVWSFELPRTHNRHWFKVHWSQKIWQANHHVLAIVLLSLRYKPENQIVENKLKAMETQSKRIFNLFVQYKTTFRDSIIFCNCIDYLIVWF